MKRPIHLTALIAVAVLSLTTPPDISAAEQAAAMVMRIEPSSGGSARVKRSSGAEEVAFMMPLYTGDELVVESPNMTVQVKVFGGDEVIVRKGEPLKIDAPPEEKGLLSSMMTAVSDKVFRNNQVSRRNLVTRGEGDDTPLQVFGLSGSLPPQKLYAGRHELIVRWNLDLDSVVYRLEALPGGQALVSGETDGDYVFLDGINLTAGRSYRFVAESADGRSARGDFEAVATAPTPAPADPALGTVGQAFGLLELAGTDNGSWKFEAIQGVLDLSADDIDRATLIEEISAL